jgi:hypothetical protein
VLWGIENVELFASHGKLVTTFTTTVLVEAPITNELSACIFVASHVAAPFTNVIADIKVVKMRAKAPVVDAIPCGAQKRCDRVWATRHRDWMR